MKKYIILLLCVVVVLMMVACEKPAPTTSGGDQIPANPSSSGQQNMDVPEKPDDGTVDPEDPSLSAYEKEFYQSFNTGYIVRFDTENFAFDISISKEENALLVVLHRRDEDRKLPTLDGEVKGNFVSDVQLFFRGQLQTTEDGTVTCKLQEHKVVMKRSGDYTDEVAEKYLAYLADSVDQGSIAQERYDYMRALLKGEAVEDTMFMGEEEYMSITAKQDGDSYTDIRVDAYDGEELECYFLVLEDMVHQIVEQGEDSYTIAYALSGRKLYEEIRQGEEFMRADYIYNDAGQLIRMEGKQNGEEIAAEEYTYDAAGNMICALRYQKGILVSKVEYDAEGNEITELEYDENGNITYGYESIFDDAGKLTQKIRYWNDGSREIRKYDENGREISSTCYDAEGVFQSGTEYVYDEFGNKVQETYRHASGAYCVETFNAKGETTSWLDYNAEGKLISGYEYTFGEEGNLLKEVYYQGEERRETTWDKGGNMLSRYYYYQNEPTEWELFTYNEAGQILSSIYYSDRYSGEVEFQSKYLYSYDEKGWMVRLECYEFENSTTPDWVETNTYDAAGNRLCNYRFNKDGSLWGWNEYTYNAAGKPLTWIHYRGEGTSNVERREEWKYNAAGECVTNLAYNSKGEIIMGHENEYDANGKLIRVKSYTQDTYEVTEYNEDHTYATRHVYNRKTNELEYWVELIIEGDTIVNEIWHYPE